MEVSLAFLADSANHTADGKINALGIFDVITASGFPVNCPDMQLVIQVRASAAETGDKNEIVVTLMDEDAVEKGVLRLVGKVPEPRRAGVPVQQQFILPLTKMAFDKAGIHTFVIKVDKSRVEVPLHVMKVVEDDV